MSLSYVLGTWMIAHITVDVIIHITVDHFVTSHKVTFEYGMEEGFFPVPPYFLGTGSIWFSHVVFVGTSGEVFTPNINHEPPSCARPEPFRTKVREL